MSTLRRKIRVVVHREEIKGGGESFWADSADMPGYTAFAASYEKLQQRVHEGVKFYFGDKGYVAPIIEFVPDTLLDISYQGIDGPCRTFTTGEGINFAIMEE